MNQQLFVGVRNTGLSLFALAVLAACQASSVPVSNLNDGSGGADGRADSGIWGQVGNADYHYNGDMRYIDADGGAHKLEVVSKESDLSYWRITGVKPELGIYDCASAEAPTLAVVLNREGQPRLSSEGGGSCELRVTRANELMLAGNFVAELIDSDGRSYSVRNGEFVFEMAHVIPDLDHDGLSDADDNCPFTANPDQADDDDNDIGNACQDA